MRFPSTNDGRDDGLDKVASDTPAIKKPRVSGQAKTDSVAEELRVLEVKDTSQMSELAIKRHTAAKTKLQLDLDRRTSKQSAQAVQSSICAEAKLIREAGAAAAKVRTMFSPEETKRLIYLRTKHNAMWNHTGAVMGLAAKVVAVVVAAMATRSLQEAVVAAMTAAVAGWMCHKSWQRRQLEDIHTVIVLILVTTALSRKYTLTFSVRTVAFEER